MEDSFCLVLDILGFRRLVQYGPDGYQTDRVDRWVELVETSCASVGVDRYQLVSDSLFAVDSPDGEGLARQILLSRLLLDGGLALQLPVRGAISKRPVRWSPQVTHGPGVVASFNLGNECEWIGVACEYDFPELEPHWSWSDVVKYPVPLKQEREKMLPAVVWDVPSDEQLRRTVGSIPGPIRAPLVRLPPVVAIKIANTARFRDYYRISRKTRESEPASIYYRGL